MGFKIGDELLFESRYKKQIVKIVRETKTQWILSNDERVRKENETVISRGSDRFGYSYVRLCTEGDRKSIWMSNVRYKIKCFDFSVMSDEDIVKVYTIIKEAEK